jgi:outer membrane immunogenic protein
MNKFLGLVIASALSMGASSSLPAKAAPPTSPTMWTWTGIYIGGQVGAAKFNSRLFEDSGDYSGVGLIGGATLGANWQMPNSPFVLGVEGDWSFSNAEGDVGAPNCGPNCQTQEHWLATIRGRIGYAHKHELFYLTAGAAFVNFGQGQPGFYYNNSITSTGYTFGGGVESMIDAHWSWKLEYLYAGFEKDKEIFDVSAPTPACPSPPGFSCSDYNRINIIRGGLNYKFF